MPNRHIPIDSDLLKKMYQDEGLSIETIARKLEVSPSKIRTELVRQSIPRRGQGSRLGSRNNNWSGGKKTSHGYILIYKPDHPHATSQGYAAEHRIVMEQLLGRYLEPQEVVHHIDENKQNNNPENLKLYPSESEHQRHAHGAGLNLSKAELARLYVEKGLSAQSIADQLNVGRHVICLLLKKYKIPTHSVGGRPIHDSTLTESALRKMYLDEGMSMRQIAKALGVGSTTVEWYMKKYGIPRRKRWNRPPISEEARRNISEAAKDRTQRRKRGEDGRFV